MSSSATATKVTTSRGGSSEAGAVQQSTIYKAVMTPVIFVSFLLSLVYVDIRHTLKRSRNHGHGGGWMPGWLHNVVYRRSPYHYMAKESSTPSPKASPSPKDEQGEWYYHSKQKKLMRMEVDDAFEMRGQVLVVLAIVSLATLWGLWVLSAWLWKSVSHMSF
ncbi:hypothetical protein CTRI78_v004717 [Colletotrichum trifolii]|uniref:Uncharacterized protein n=1 Tax=Colletotrichum trifolii TaxID=5466 RepID=A0A4R8RJY1_COLTR|nr:hypothetical protein CTRI78_v004717 [Colletotrichum trifolii]